MKLLIVSHSSNVGGTEVCFDRALRHLVSVGHEVVAAYPDGTFAPEWERLAPREYFIGSLPPRRSLKGYLGWIVRHAIQGAAMRQTLRRLRPDAVVVFSSVITAAVSAAHAVGVPCVVYVREFVEPDTVQARLWRFLGAKATRLIAVSAAIAAALEPYAPGRVTVIHDGVEVPAEAASPRTTAPLVACYAGYNPAKGAELFVRAAAVVAPACPSARFALLGVAHAVEQDHARHLRALAVELGLGERLEFVETRHFAGTFARASVVVVPSLREGLGLVALEAMASGVPVVASATGGLLDIVVEGETGRLFEPGSAGSLAEVLARVLAEDNLLAMGAAGRRRALESFSVQGSMAGLDEVLGAK